MLRVGLPDVPGVTLGSLRPTEIRRDPSARERPDSAQKPDPTRPAEMAAANHNPRVGGSSPSSAIAVPDTRQLRRGGAGNNRLAGSAADDRLCATDASKRSPAPRPQLPRTRADEADAMMVVHGAWHALGSIRGCVEGQQPSYAATSEVAEEMRDAARGKTVIDATNPQGRLQRSGCDRAVGCRRDPRPIGRRARRQGIQYRTGSLTRSCHPRRRPRPRCRRFSTLNRFARSSARLGSFAATIAS